MMLTSIPFTGIALALLVGAAGTWLDGATDCHQTSEGVSLLQRSSAKPPHVKVSAEPQVATSGTGPVPGPAASAWPASPASALAAAAELLQTPPAGGAQPAALAAVKRTDTQTTASGAAPFQERAAPAVAVAAVAAVPNVLPAGAAEVAAPAAVVPADTPPAASGAVNARPVAPAAAMAAEAALPTVLPPEPLAAAVPADTQAIASGIARAPVQATSFQRAEPSARLAAPVAVPSPQSSVPGPAAAVQVQASQPTPLVDARPSGIHYTRFQYLTAFFQLLQGISFAFVVKALCMAGNVLVQVSPFPEVKAWKQTGCTGESDAAPYVSIAFCGWQWCFYGVFAWLITGQRSFLILVYSNCLGALLGAYYIMEFYNFCAVYEARHSFQRYLTSAALLVAFQLCCIMMLPLGNALLISGLVSSFGSFVGAISMLSTVPAVLRARDSSSIPGMLCTCYAFSAMVWCVCGFILGDPLVICPNVASVFSSAVCIFLKYRFPSCRSVFKDQPSAMCIEPVSESPAKRREGKGFTADDISMVKTVELSQESLSPKQVKTVEAPQESVSLKK